MGVLSGCHDMSNEIAEVLRFNEPTPSEAAMWMFHRDAEKRRLGITLISNAEFGGESPYLKVYREAVTDLDSMVRAASVRALGMHGNGEDALLAIPLTVDDSQIVRWEAVKALQRLHHTDAVRALLVAVNTDEDADVRAAAATALGQYAQLRVAESLILSLSDQSLIVNCEAKKSLKTLTGENFGIDQDNWLEWYQDNPNVFANQQVYTYPTYQRDYTFMEKVTPFGKQSFESPGIPAGIELEASTNNTQPDIQSQDG